MCMMQTTTLRVHVHGVPTGVRMNVVVKPSHTQFIKYIRVQMINVLLTAHLALSDLF